MATPTLIFNTGTGSDTTASGSQGAVVANGTAASFAASVVTLDGSPDLSGFVAADDILWLQTDSGRQFFDITSVDDGADTVTTVDAPAGTASGLTWGIGGKRATWDDADSRTLLETDVKESWIIETETAQTLTSTLTLTATLGGRDYPTVRGSSGSRKTITQTANAPHWTITSNLPDSHKWERLKFENTNGTKTSAYGIYQSINNASACWYVYDCEFGDAVNTLASGWYGNGIVSGRFSQMQVVDTYVHDCTGDGWHPAGNFVNVNYIFNSMFVSNGGVGCYLMGVMGGAANGLVFGSVFANNAGTGMTAAFGGNQVDETFGVINNTFSENGGDGWAWAGVEATSSVLPGGLVPILNNDFSNNGGYGIGGTDVDLLSHVGHIMRNNNFFGNTSGDMEEGDFNSVDGTAVDPEYADVANNDFTPGVNLKGQGFPNNVGKAGLTTSYTDIGAAQREEVGAAAPFFSTYSDSLLTR